MNTIESDDNVLFNNLIKIVPVISKQEADSICSDSSTVNKKIKELRFEFPFDDGIVNELHKLLPLKSDKSLYHKIDIIKNLWITLIDKSIKCLRYFDNREPYLKYDKKSPQSYGLNELSRYYEEFAEFEALLYGSNRFYRDHVIHLLRTWLIGMNILIFSPKGTYLYKEFIIEGDDRERLFKFNFFECISIWTIASLCHDLGYPLEKSNAIINRTQRMMEYLVLLILSLFPR